METKRIEGVCILAGGVGGGLVALAWGGLDLAVLVRANLPIHVVPLILGGVTWGAVGALVGCALGWFIGRVVTALCSQR